MAKSFRGCVILLLVMALNPIRADEVEVFAAASLTDVLNEIATDYEKTSGDKIIFNFAASNTLEMQIKAGAPADIFFSADEAKMNDLAKAGLLGTSRMDLLSNRLVIIVPADSTATLKSTKDLAGDTFKKIALGETRSVPAGIYARQYLTTAGIWDQIAPRVIPSENVRAALAAVETGNVDAGIVYKTDALHSKKVKIAFEAPLDEQPMIAYPVAILGDSKHISAAEKFLDYLDNPETLKIFEKYGFITGIGTK